MVCFGCDSKRPLTKTEKKLYKFVECGLDYVTLRGVTVYRCESCGEELFQYGNLDAIHATIAHAIVTQKKNLDSADVRFLRKYLGYSSETFQNVVGRSLGTIARYESDRKPPKDYQNFLRLMVLNKEPDRNYSKHDAIKEISDLENSDKKQLKTLVIAKNRDKWSSELAYA